MLLNPRPGSRVLISCSSQLLPSGSLKVAKVRRCRRPGPGPEAAGPPRAGEVERLAHVDAAADEFRACRLDVGHDEIQVLEGARHRGRDSLAEVDGARRAGRGHLHHPPVRSVGEVGVQPPPQASVEALGAIDVGHRNDDHLELQVDRRGGGTWVVRSLLVCAVLMGDLRRWWQVARRVTMTASRLQGPAPPASRRTVRCSRALRAGRGGRRSNRRD